MSKKEPKLCRECAEDLGVEVKVVGKCERCGKEYEQKSFSSEYKEISKRKKIC